MTTFNELMVERIQELISENEEISRKEFVASVGKIFSELKGKPERKKREPKKADSAKDKKEVKPKRAPSKWNLFLKEHMSILTLREKEKDGEEPKKTTRELMQEIGEMWKLEKEGVLSQNNKKTVAKATKSSKVVEESDTDEEEEKPKNKHSSAKKDAKRFVDSEIEEVSDDEDKKQDSDDEKSNDEEEQAKKDASDDEEEEEKPKPKNVNVPRGGNKKPHEKKSHDKKK